MPSFSMKRSRSPDFVGISNYKRQRLIEDLQNLSISDNATGSTSSATKVVADNNWIDNQQIWKVVSGQKDANNDIYRPIWESIRDSNLQVIKWYDSASLVYRSWLLWYHQKQADEMDMEIDEDGHTTTYQENDDYGYEPMLLDT
ncbi:LAME_0H07866g1_1 [Lachancea meyersii CBS 8951]|uniref:LAME_0H07866g1_1 n=1 Tax=Lachancea meyersii CBS 8951 TaxID=1266667 RepID=A0A1G4KF78_9SACH|nr:LAME_0H07866g1_1 [Lachancea meyersii CBS 8951]